MIHPPIRATHEEWIAWLKRVREDPKDLPSELRFAIKQFDELAIEASKQWFLKNPR
jgi:hypothetical protein